ncbi:MAG: PilZ domain-containing protein [Bdellovibrionales bacterium]|nr:PilZ domain-containing protein [Bdellovibrionales bacterium]
MRSKNYQRKHLRAPFKETVLYVDGNYILKARAINISEGGLLIDELPSFPEADDVAIMISLPQLPSLKNFSILKMQTFSKELFQHKVIRVKAKMVRREQLSQDLDNIFRSRFGLQFIRISDQDQKHIEDYVVTFASNLIFLQTLIDSFNSDEDTKIRARTLAGVLGYKDIEKIAHLRAAVTHDYKSLQWL